MPAECSPCWTSTVPGPTSRVEPRATISSTRSSGSSQNSSTAHSESFRFMVHPHLMARPGPHLDGSPFDKATRRHRANQRDQRTAALDVSSFVDGDPARSPVVQYG